MPKKRKIQKSPGVDLEAKELTFEYIKSKLFRVIYVDGAIGGPSSGGNYLQINIFNERWPIPQQTVHNLSPEGRVGAEKVDKRKYKDAIIREVEATLIMNIDSAMNLYKWFEVHLKPIVESAQKEDEK
jgi:hypothetical protein